MIYIQQAFSDCTWSTYKTQLKVWIDWCNYNKVSPLTTCAGNLADCMTQRLSNGEKKSSILNMRSAVSTVIGLATGRRLGQEYVTSLVNKAMNKLEPHKSKYRQVWNLCILMDYLAEDDQFASTAQAVAELKRKVILRVPNQKFAALFMRTSGLSSLTANEISDGVRRLMKNAGLDISVFGAYSAKAAGFSQMSAHGFSNSDIAQHARLSAKSQTLNRYYIKPIILPSMNSQQSHPSQQTQPPPPHSKPCSARLKSWEESKTDETDEPTRYSSLRPREAINLPLKMKDYVVDPTHLSHPS
ncbi:MAG: hypothetical protein EZS28_025426 [Streblomastix strix]|uniref:Tyr recombinase domain-containing protein n=1 Tax=Streblomastix strix TaxID=222440 RepID=A0A5J4V9C9_9EUKA|nr:MAG: hypothetical protein EZS28_025426 [Streblomastix strix]